MRPTTDSSEESGRHERPSGRSAPLVPESLAPGSWTAWLLGASPGKPRRRSRFVFLFTVITGATVLVYLNSLQGGLVLDNAAIIGADQRIRSVDHIGEILTTNYWSGTSKSANFRPLTTLSYLFNYAVLGNGTRPFGYHVFNTILHAIVAFLVSLLVLGLGEALLPALCAGLIFAVHPAMSEAVANIVGRADLLAALFVLAGLLAHLRARTGPHPTRWWLAACLAYALAMAGKESGVVFIALVAALDWIYRRRSGWMPARRRIARDYGGYLIVLVLMQIWRIAVVSQQHWLEISHLDNPLVLASFGEREATVVKLLAIYAARCFFPLHLSADNSWRQIELVRGLGDPWFWGGVVVVVVALGGAAWAMRRRQALLAYALLVPAVSLAPVSNAFLLIGTILAERLLYLPLVGVSIAAAWVLCRLARRLARGRPRRQIYVVAALLLLVAGLFGARTVARNPIWSDDLGFWRQTHAESPRSIRAVNGYATALAAAFPNDPARAVAIERRGVEIDPDDVRCRANLSLFLTALSRRLVKQGRHAEAGSLLEEAERHARHAVSVDGKQAEAWFSRHPGYPGGPAAAPVSEERAYRALAGVLMARVRLGGVGRADRSAVLFEAQDALRRAVLVRPDRIEPMVALTENLLAQGKFEDAVVSGLWVLETSHGTDPRLSSLLGSAYRGAGLDPVRFLRVRPGLVDIATPARGARVADAAGRKQARLLGRAYRMLIKILLAGDHRESARALASYAAARRGVSAGELNPLFVVRPGADQDGFWE